MNPQAVLRKTAKGTQELQTRALGLDRGLRNALILVDGQSTVAQIAAKASAIQGLEASLRALVDQGFVELAGGKPSGTASAPARGDAARAKQELIRLAKAVLGADAARIMPKLEAAPESRDALIEVTNQCKKVVRLLIDEKKADELMARCQVVLNGL